MRIVLIDSDPCITETFSFLLKDQGHSVLTAFSGRAGIALALAAEPDVVIVGFELNDVEGADVIKILHRTPSRNSCKFIAMVDGTNSKISQRALAAGASFILTRDTQASELVRLTSRI